ncbi:MAG: hypothetical protein FWG67_09475 [Defluviitaleaceae bacterium]|nr:hypothetical protein [Defluviitaleaceae bacterium]
MINKKEMVFILIGAVFMILTACERHEHASPHNFPVSDMSAYEIEGEHRFYDVTMYEALQLIEDPSFDGMLYFGFPTCPWCQAAVPVIHEASQEVGVDIFYVSRRHDLRADEWLEWDELMAWWLYEQTEDMRWIYLDETGSETTEVTNEPLRPNIFVPHVVHVRNQTVIDQHRGTFEGHDAPNDPGLTEEAHETLLRIYRNMFSHVGLCPVTTEVSECA